MSYLRGHAKAIRNYGMERGQRESLIDLLDLGTVVVNPPIRGGERENLRKEIEGVICCPKRYVILIEGRAVPGVCPY